MHPYYHARTSVKCFGGVAADYQPIHDWIDASKEHFPDARHRAVRHHSQGIFECERVFGTTITNSEGKQVPVRYVAEQHIMEDCGGRVPSLQDWLSEIKMQTWMNRTHIIGGRRADKDAGR